MSLETSLLDRPIEDLVPRPALSAGALILTPMDPHLAPDPGLLIEGLIKTGLLGRPLLAAGGGQTFTIGPAFLGLISFTGCAVQIRDAAEEGPFTHIRIPPVSPHPRLLAGHNTRPPRCLNCRTPLLDWRERASFWASHPHAGVSCPQCSETRPPWLWDWKHQGGFGRLFVRIEEVFPGEAVPSDALFEQLIRISGTTWRHFYLQPYPEIGG